MEKKKSTTFLIKTVGNPDNFSHSFPSTSVNFVVCCFSLESPVTISKLQDNSVNLLRNENSEIQYLNLVKC